MAYTPTVWASGDTIDATKLNKIEQGIANAGSMMIVDCPDTSPYTLDHTFADIYNALRAGTPVYVRIVRNVGSDWASQYNSEFCFCPVVRAFKYNDAYRLCAVNATNCVVDNAIVLISSSLSFDATGANAYPTLIRKTSPKDTSLNVENQPW